MFVLKIELIGVSRLTQGSKNMKVDTPADQEVLEDFLERSAGNHGDRFLKLDHSPPRAKTAPGSGKRDLDYASDTEPPSSATKAIPKQQIKK